MSGGKGMTLGKVRSFAENVALHYGWKLNPDAGLTDVILQGLLKNHERFGYLQCPCREAWEDHDMDRDVICPCRYSADDIREYGRCYCALFLASDTDPEKTEFSTIPERRAPAKRP